MKIISDGKIWREFENDLVKGYIPVEDCVTKSPTLLFKYELIPISLLQECLGFFIDVFEKYKGEGQVRLYYSPEQKTWKAWAFPQKASGMTTTEMEDSPEFKKDRQEQISRDFIALGTIHSHCDMSAFQSGTDHQDELRQDGIHITMGKINSKKIDYHARLVFKGQMYSAVIEDHVNEVEEQPEWMKEIPEEYRGGFNLTKFMLDNLKPSKYPEKWLANVEDGRTPYPCWRGGSDYYDHNDDYFKEQRILDNILSPIVLACHKKFKLKTVGQLDRIWDQRFYKVNENISKVDKDIIDFIQDGMKRLSCMPYEFNMWLIKNKTKSFKDIEKMCDWEYIPSKDGYRFGKKDMDVCLELVTLFLSELEPTVNIEDSDFSFDPTAQVILDIFEDENHAMRNSSQYKLLICDMEYYKVSDEQFKEWLIKNKDKKLTDLLDNGVVKQYE